MRVMKNYLKTWWGDVKIDGWMELKWYVEWMTWKDARSKCKFNSGFSTTLEMKKGWKYANWSLRMKRIAIRRNFLIKRRKCLKFFLGLFNEMRDSCDVIDLMGIELHLIMFYN